MLWLNSIATRTPSITSARDLGKIRRKLAEFTSGPVNVENDLWVTTPLVLPLPHSPRARAINRQIVRWTIRSLRTQLGISRFQLWTFLPNTADYVGTLGEELAVYYCVDEWATFPGLDEEATRAAERRLLERVDLTFATSHALVERKRALCPATHLSPHGVDHALFAQALLESTPVPDDLAALPRPRIGFFGTLRDFIDVGLLAAIARARPTWSLALIGQQLTNLSELRGLPNVHLLGQRPHAQLPAYCKGFDAGLIPYRIDAAVKYINPLKLREYLSAGVPVVSTAMPEVMRYARLCQIASSPAEMVTAIEHALAEDDPAMRAARSAAMASETWAGRVADVLGIVSGVAARKRPAIAAQTWRLTGSRVPVRGC